MNATLADLFTEGTPEYQRYWIWSMDTLPFIVNVSPGIREVRAGYAEGIKAALIKLSSLRSFLEEKLADMEEVVSVAPESPQGGRSPSSGKNVFIVHGHDDRMKQTVARFLERLGLKPIVLHEQASNGRTVIEKLEANANVDFAIVLLTPDDVGGPVAEPEARRHRARQNVILELGLFIGRLGRDKVCALHTGDLELPSDYAGVVYVPFDAAEGWKMLVAREMRSAGLELDLNRLLEG